MSAPPRIVALAGSTRRDSFNKRLVRIAAGGAPAAGAEVRVIDLRDFPLPLFDQDLEREQGPPEAATRLKALMVGSDGLLIASPEYNSSITDVLKNALDWASRPAPGEPPLVAFTGKAEGPEAAGDRRGAGPDAGLVPGQAQGLAPAEGRTRGEGSSSSPVVDGME